MESPNCTPKPCAICGADILSKPASDSDCSSMDHVPPKQFYPKELREKAPSDLWCVPTHKRCNEQYRKDEEYFYHALLPIVLDGNRSMGRLIWRDLKRRTCKPQTPAMIRRVLKDVRKNISAGGIHLPPGVSEWSLDRGRIERVVLKVIQGLFYLDQYRHLPPENCRDLRLCIDPADVPEFYRLTCRNDNTMSVLPEVFVYHRGRFRSLHVYSLLFWEALMFCVAFDEPGSVTH